jgi:hypothetical protein
VAYLYVTVDNVQMTAFQVVWAIFYGEYPRGRVTTRNSDNTDLRIANFRTTVTVDGQYDHSTSEGRAAYRRAYRAMYPEHYKSSVLKAIFGIDMGKYKQMLEEQRGVCAICKLPETVMRKGKISSLAVDHDHKNSAIRGLLCQTCNHGIGKLHEDTKIMRSAIAYIEHHRVTQDHVELLHAGQAGERRPREPRQRGQHQLDAGEVQRQRKTRQPKQTGQSALDDRQLGFDLE